MKKMLLGVGIAFSSLLCVLPASARSLKEALETGLFGGGPSLLTVDLGSGQGNVPILGADRESFGQPILGIGGIGSSVTQAISNDILSESVVVPVPSGSAGFAYEYNPSLKLFEKSSIGLGTIFNERVSTLGKGAFAFGVAYVRQDFDEYNGDDIANLRVDRSLFADPPFLGALVDTGAVEATLDLDITTNSVAIWGTYGLTHWLDVSLLLPITSIDFRARSTLRPRETLQEDITGFFPDPLCTLQRALNDQCRIAEFVTLPRGIPFTLTNPRNPDGAIPVSGISDVVDETKTGVGDLLLRGKAQFFERRWGAFGGLVEFTVPTGDTDNFLGDGAFKARFLLLQSLSFFDNRLNFHLNGGGRVTTQTSQKNTLEYGSSMDMVITERISLVAELIGSWRVDSGGLPDNFIDAAFGFKANPFRGLILSASFRIPATDDGLRSDLVYLAGLEYDF